VLETAAAETVFGATLMELPDEVLVFVKPVTWRVLVHDWL